jgi:hypothetical protein
MQPAPESRMVGTSEAGNGSAFTDLPDAIVAFIECGDCDNKNQSFCQMAFGEDDCHKWDIIIGGDYDRGDDPHFPLPNQEVGGPGDCDDVHDECEPSFAWADIRRAVQNRDVHALNSALAKTSESWAELDATTGALKLYGSCASNRSATMVAHIIVPADSRAAEVSRCFARDVLTNLRRTLLKTGPGPR